MSPEGPEGMSRAAETVIAVDPGRSKCGVAAVRRSAAGEIEVLHQEVVETAGLAEAVRGLGARFSPDLVVVGNGTGSSGVVGAVESLGIGRVKLVDEECTTLRARARFFAENPPRGIRRLLPLSLQTPGRPYDDYVAVILAETHLST